MAGLHLIMISFYPSVPQVIIKYFSGEKSAVSDRDKCTVRFTLQAGNCTNRYTLAVLMLYPGLLQIRVMIAESCWNGSNSHKKGEPGLPGSPGHMLSS